MQFTHTRTFATAKGPISPSINIYRFPLPAMASVANRFTGIGMSVGVATTGICCLVGDPYNLPLWIDSFKSVPLMLPVVKMIVSFPFVYHTVSGVRHMYWDKTASGLELDSVRSSTYLVIGASVVGTLLLAGTTLPAKD